MLAQVEFGISNEARREILLFPGNMGLGIRRRKASLQEPSYPGLQVANLFSGERNDTVTARTGLGIDRTEIALDEVDSVTFSMGQASYPTTAD